MSLKVGAVCERLSVSLKTVEPDRTSPDMKPYDSTAHVLTCEPKLVDSSLLQLKWRVEVLEPLYAAVAESVSEQPAPPFRSLPDVHDILGLSYFMHASTVHAKEASSKGSAGSHLMWSQIQDRLHGLARVEAACFWSSLMAELDRRASANAIVNLLRAICTCQLAPEISLPLYSALRRGNDVFERLFCIWSVMGTQGDGTTDISHAFEILFSEFKELHPVLLHKAVESLLVAASESKSEKELDVARIDFTTKLLESFFAGGCRDLLATDELAGPWLALGLFSWCSSVGRLPPANVTWAAQEFARLLYSCSTSLGSNIWRDVCSRIRPTLHTLLNWIHLKERSYVSTKSLMHSPLFCALLEAALLINPAEYGTRTDGTRLLPAVPCASSDSTAPHPPEARPRGRRRQPVDAALSAAAPSLISAAHRSSVNSLQVASDSTMHSRRSASSRREVDAVETILNDLRSIHVRAGAFLRTSDAVDSSRTCFDFQANLQLSRLYAANPFSASPACSDSNASLSELSKYPRLASISPDLLHSQLGKLREFTVDICKALPYLNLYPAAVTNRLVHQVRPLLLLKEKRDSIKLILDRTADSNARTGPVIRLNRIRTLVQSSLGSDNYKETCFAQACSQVLVGSIGERRFSSF